MYTHVLTLNEKEKTTPKVIYGLNAARVTFISKTELMKIPRIPNLYPPITITMITIPSNVTMSLEYLQVHYLVLEITRHKIIGISSGHFVSSTSF